MYKYMILYIHTKDNTSTRISVLVEVKKINQHQNMNMNNVIDCVRNAKRLVCRNRNTHSK